MREKVREYIFNCLKCIEFSPSNNKVGDYVEIRNIETTTGINKKLVPMFKGPYVVKKALDRDRYVVADIDGFQLIQRPYTGILAPDQMRPYMRT